MEAFSSQADGNLTIVKENSPTDFVVEQNLKTMFGARTSVLDTKTGHVILISAEFGPAPEPAPGAKGRGGRGPILPGTFSDPRDRQVISAWRRSPFVGRTLVRKPTPSSASRRTPGVSRGYNRLRLEALYQSVEQASACNGSFSSRSDPSRDHRERSSLGRRVS